MPLSYKQITVSITALDLNTTDLISHSPSIADGALTTYTMEDNYLRTKIPDNLIQFTNPNSWKKVTVFYYPLTSSQTKILTFRRRSGVLTAVSSWDQYSTLGTWRISDVLIVNKTGEILKLAGISFPIQNDILVS